MIDVNKALPEMTETLEQFSERLSHVEKREEFQVGPRHRGHSRAVFVFDGMWCYLESTGYKRLDAVWHVPTPAKLFNMIFSEPKDSWWTNCGVFGKDNAERIAARFNGTVDEAPYGPDDFWLFYFKEFEDLTRFLYARKNGEIPEIDAPENQVGHEEIIETT